jgi:uncharacterized membrane protein YjfL (UPF0719 family)
MNSSLRWFFYACVATGLLLIALALRFWGAAEIRADIGEVVFLTLIGGVWLIVAAKLFSWLGLSFRDDVVDRNNVAALTSLGGAVIAVAIIYAGGSLGEGPSYMNNFFSAALGTGGLVVLWILLEVGGKVSRSVTEDRDLASGVRMCGFLLAVGLVLGRAVAGDWHSEYATLHDFVTDGWPAIPILGVALAIERRVRPCMRRPFPSWPCSGLIPALLYLLLAGGWLWHLGAWEGMPR